MRSLRIWYVVLAVASITAAQQRTAWTVVSAQGLDARIQRQVERLASDRHASIRFSQPAAKDHGTSSESEQLVFQFETSGDAASFQGKLQHEAGGSTITPTPELMNEGYILRVTYSRRSEAKKPLFAEIHIEAVSAAGFHHALLRVPVILDTRDGTLPDLVPRPQSMRSTADGRELVIADYPAFPIRGIVEGFYGPPWSHGDRLDMLRFLGQHGMNIYIYGPKDDPYHRRLWREDYPAADMKRLAELAGAARENFVDFTFAISPGLSMSYSSDADFQTLTKKLESVAGLGITNFALFLDDVPQDLVHPEDQVRFRTLAQAHIYLINRLYEHLKAMSTQNRLTVCPTTYTNEWGNRDYIRELGAGLKPEIPLDWTGPEVIPEKITVAQAKEWGGYLQRKPLVWDNFPTNDSTPWWLNLGPVHGREVGLYSVTQGLFSNPMYQVHLTMIPLETVADYLWNPVSYVPEQSRTHALVDLYGGDAPEFLASLFEIFQRSPDGTSLLGSMFSETWAPIDLPAIETQIARLNSLIAILKTQPRFQKLVNELSPMEDTLRDQLASIRKADGFKHLPDGKIQWDRDHDVLIATRITGKPVLDGDFAKWESGTVYDFNSKSHLDAGGEAWMGPAQFSARFALSWDEQNLYVGVDVTNPQPYQPFHGRGIENGDAVRLIVDTTLPIAAQHGRPKGVFDLYLSPGNFSTVPPSIFCDEDFFPLRARPHNYDQEIPAIWKKTATGFSGDIVLPAAFFERKDFSDIDEIGMSFGVQHVLPPEKSSDDPARMAFTSKKFRFFPVESQSPATLQRVILTRSSVP